MTTAAHVFALITAELEDLHSVAVDGQYPELAANEGDVLIVGLRGGIVRLRKLVSRADRRLKAGAAAR